MEMNSNKIVSILGLPRQGTTLISGIFNSPPNFFSAVEPHWSKICGLEISSGNKIPVDLLTGHHPSMVIPLLKRHMENSNHLDVCSIKETYRHQEKECCDYLINSDLVDVHLFIYRNPLFGFNGWKKAGWEDWYNQVQNYKDCYRADCEFVWAYCRYFWESHVQMNNIDISELEHFLKTNKHLFF